MALIINQSGLKDFAGGELPDTGVLVRFGVQVPERGTDFLFSLKFYRSTQSEADGFSPVSILHRPSDLQGIPDQFIRKYHPSELATLNPLVLHEAVKDQLSLFIDPDNIDIRLDLL